MASEILIIDDNRVTLEAFANEVRLNIGVEPFTADKSEQALKILREFDVKVLVVDQNLEGDDLTGTELVRKVREELKLDIPCIMITGQRSTVSVQDMVNLDFFRFIVKGQSHGELTQAIQQGLHQHHLASMGKHTKPVDAVLTEKKNIIRFNTLVTARLKSISSVVESYIRDQDWKTEDIAQQGKSTVKEIKVSRRAKYMFEQTIETSMLSKLDFSFKKVIDNLETSLESRVAFIAKDNYEEELIIELKETVTISEISDKAKKEGAILQSREYQTAPVYTRVNCVIEILCNCCGIPKQLNLFVLLPTDTIALRHVEHYDKGPTRTVYVGKLHGSVRTEPTS